MSNIKSLDDLRGLTPDELRTAVRAIQDELHRLNLDSNDELRDMSPTEQNRFNTLVELEGRALDKVVKLNNIREVYERSPNAVHGVNGTGSVGGPGASGNHPLLISADNLRAASEALRGGRPWAVQQDPPGEQRAMLQTSTMGSDASWATSTLPGPQSLRQFAGIPISPLTGTKAEMPSITPPAGVAGAAESAQHQEFAGVALASLTVSRFGRWTQVSAATSSFDDLSGINSAHAVGIARDLNLADFGVVDTAAGAAVAYASGQLDAQIRSAVLRVSAATMADPTQCVILGSSADLGLATGYQPANGDDRGSVSLRVYGSRVYCFEQCTAGFVWILNPLAFRAFQGGAGAATFIDPKDGSQVFGTWVHSTPVGVGYAGGVAKIDTTSP
jgi:hypothetical protein